MSGKIRFLLGAGGGAILLAVGIALAVKLSRSAQEATLAASLPAPVAEGTQAARTLLAEAERFRAEGDLLNARQLYQKILQSNPESSVAATAAARLGQVNLKLILSPTPTPDSEVHVVEQGDTLSKIAKRHRITVDLLKSSNGLESDLIRPGQRLKVAKVNFSVVVDKSLNTLTLKNGEEVLKVYRCSTGKGGITPVGEFKVANRLVDPPWFTPNGVIPPGDPRNILGTRWLGFDLPGYGIHGTTDPESVGKPITQGCVRLVNADAEELFTLLPEGASVTIVE